MGRAIALRGDAVSDATGPRRSSADLTLRAKLEQRGMPERQAARLVRQRDDGEHAEMIAAALDDATDTVMIW